MAKVVIAGPNLRDQDKGQFHVHTEGCRDLTRMVKREPAYKDAWQEDVQSRQEIVELIYEDQMDKWESTHPGEVLDWREYDDIYLFPCVNGLPDLTPGSEEEDDDEDSPLEHASTLATKHGESDGEQSADEAMTRDTILGYIEENVDDELLGEGSTDELDAIATAYVESFLDAFTAKVRRNLADFLDAEEGDEED